MSKSAPAENQYHMLIEVCAWIRKHRSHPVATQLQRVTSQAEMIALYDTVRSTWE